jgi:ABC-2 type transport system permease protein
MNPILRLVIRDFRVMNRSLLVVQFMLPFFLLFVAGFAYKTLIPPSNLGYSLYSYQQFLAVGLVAQTAMTGSLLSGTLLWTDKRHGMFEQILVGPFTKFQYVVSKVVSSALVGLSGAALVFIISTLFFFNNIRPTLLGSLIGLYSVLVGSLLFGAIAILIASNVKSLEAFEGILNLLLILLTFVSSVLYPIVAAPPLLRYIILINPLTYMSDMLRYGIMDIAYSNIYVEAILLAVEGVTAIALAIIFLYKAASSI